MLWPLPRVTAAIRCLRWGFFPHTGLPRILLTGFITTTAAGFSPKGFP